MSTTRERPAISASGLGLNRRAEALVRMLLQEAETLRLKATRLDNGTLLIDAGIACPGGLEAGRRIAEISEELISAPRSSLQGPTENP